MGRIQQVTAGMMVALMLAIAGPARGAEVPLPAQAINDEVPVVVWLDFSSLNTDAIRASVQAIADAMPAEMAETRDMLLDDMLADAEATGSGFERMRDAGVHGMLFVVDTAGMEGGNMMGLLYTAEGTTPESVQEQINAFNEENGMPEAAAETRVEPYEGNWMRIVEEDSVEMRDGDEEYAEAFRELLNSAGDAPIRIALRLTDRAKQGMLDEAAGDPMMAGMVDMLGNLETGWMALELGDQPRLQNRLHFNSAAAAAEFNGAWQGLLMMAEGMFMGEVGRVEGAPGPDAVQRLFQSLAMEQDDDALELTLGNEFLEGIGPLAPVLTHMIFTWMMGDAAQHMDQWDMHEGQ
ncbi:hypothetical protein ACERK3_02565 [Phycisphaerales bacterium AB-hyl4]|uniref:DUF3352 domain-containing protein n=1 Tax=Natronomicrosphaera hydrolytica TaxID=3242702 RepID=A0ABV4U0Q3_9BACT